MSRYLILPSRKVCVDVLRMVRLPRLNNILVFLDLRSLLCNRRADILEFRSQHVVPCWIRLSSFAITFILRDIRRMPTDRPRLPLSGFPICCDLLKINVRVFQ